MSTRFQAEHTIIGDIKTACDELTKRILEMSDKIVEKRAAMQSNGNGESSNGEETSLSYLCCRGDDVVNFMEVDVHDSNKLWRALHDGQVRY